ncbi:hypothetical protein UCDDA912_g00739 [Diaporthe ampelina]|uniref:Uncharacterized protein n=1 Tax=Diaporthe ampelina TaxID=1214573 RepID=A0A0G2IFZ4_9PEZI|nr:hypothetical protein UCDDA912_g00739 [Diaporthe ampelina]
MSHYPYGYGFQGQQPPQQQYPYQPYGAYPTPGYGAQPSPQQQPPPATVDYYAATQSAYDYNANNIPGLGTPSTAPQFSGPFGGQWDQDSPLPQSKTQPKEVQLKEQSRQPLKDIDSQDEGEISDGEFDDLYEDVYEQPVVAQKTKVPSQVSSEGHATSSTDQAANFYDTEVDEAPASNDRPEAAVGEAPGGEVLKEQEPMRTERDRSGSYSPYLSPREIEQEDPKLQVKADDHEAGTKSVAISFAASSPDDQDQAIPINQSKDTNNAMGQTGPGSNAPQVFRSLPEAQNEAKKAILRLLPHGVKFQTYLDEGFDEKVIKDLFVQLNLAPVTTDSASSGKPQEIQENKTQDQDAKSSQASQADAMAKKQEERKDKIARLLAEKKAKAAVEATTTGPKAPSASTSTGASTPSTPTTKPTTQAQKTLLLQQKMEALRKAREARTQQAGGKTATVDLKAMEKAIADYKRKIQEAEARAKVKPSTGSSTSQSPSAGGMTPTEQATRPVVHRVVSTGDVDDKNGPSAQLLQEAEAAKTTNPQVFSPPAGHSRVERRVRKASAQSPRLSTKLQDKIAELKRMEEEKRRLQAEIDAELAQQKRMEEEGMEDDTDELDSDSAGGHVSECMPTDKAATSSGESGQVEAEQTTYDGPLQSMPMDLESLSEKSDPEVEPSTSASLAPASAAVDETGSNPTSTQDPGLVDDASQPPASQPAEVLAAIATSAPAQEHAVAVADSNTSDDYEPPDEAGNDRSMNDSPPFSPAPAENAGNVDAIGGGLQETALPSAMPTQISTAMIPNDDPTIEAHDKIILELGSSDDLAGDQKKTFNNGLRELVASFQRSKIRDFRTIAQGIVEFRRRFLGDSSRVLHLEGVSI